MTARRKTPLITFSKKALFFQKVDYGSINILFCLQEGGNTSQANLSFIVQGKSTRGQVKVEEK